MDCNNQQDLIQEFKSQEFKNKVREFTTPLVALQQLLNLIQNSPEDIRNWITLIKTNNRRLLESMNNVIFCSQYDEETESYPPIPMTSINLGELIEDIYSELLPDAKSKNLNLVLNIHTGEAGEVLGNAEYLKRGIRNLIDNAIKFTQVGTVSITFSVVSQNGKRIITISDTGCGIKQEMRNTLFDRYRPHLSSGLGLYVARVIAQKHGGSVLLVESNSKGSTFEFSLPSVPS